MINIYHCEVTTMIIEKKEMCWSRGLQLVVGIRFKVEYNHNA